MTSGREFSDYFPMAERLKSTYNIDHLCTDGFDVYAKYSISQHHHTTKKETALVESKNSLLRNFLARLNRRTKRFTKSNEMLYLSILLLFNQNLIHVYL